MIHRHIFHNDRLVPIENVRLSPGQAGLLSGYGIFTTLQIFDGEAFAYERHWRRLQKDAARTRMPFPFDATKRSEEHTSELQSRLHLVCRLLLEKKKKKINSDATDCRRLT